MSRSFLLAWRNLFRNVRRTVAILFTVALGAGALFSFEGFIRGVLDDYRDNIIHSYYGHGQVNTRGYRESVFENPMAHWMSDREQIEAFLLGVNGVEQIFPRVSFSALLSHGHVTVGGQGQGVEASREATFFHGLELERGVALCNQQKGIILGLGMAKALGIGVGDTVDVMATTSEGACNRASFTVCGIFHTGKADYDNRLFRIQLPEAQTLLASDEIEHYSIALKEGANWDAFAGQVQGHFEDLEATSFAVLDKIHYQHSVDWLKAQFRVVQIIILSIVLLGIFNTISAAILERKQEIGNMRANGESIFSVMRLIITEGLLLALLGSAFGIFFSYFILTMFVDQGILMPPSPGSTRQFFVTFRFCLSMVWSTISLSVVAALIASTMAGLRVARMPIAKALRSI